MIGSLLLAASVASGAGASPTPAGGTSPEAILKRLVEPEFVRRVGEVRLTGTTDPRGTEPRRTVEEKGTWPDRYERRAVPGSDGWMRLSSAGFLTPTRGPGGTGTAVSSFAVARLRSLFVLKHLAQAVANRSPLRTTKLGDRPMTAVEVSDPYGRFRIVWGGPANSLQGIEMGEQSVYFTAFARTGPWMYPAVHAYERRGVLTEVLRVTTTSTRPADH